VLQPPIESANPKRSFGVSNWPDPDQEIRFRYVVYPWFDVDRQWPTPLLFIIRDLLRLSLIER